MKDLKKERKLLEDTAAKLLELARQNGAEHAEICASYNQKSKVTLEKQDFHLASADEGYQFGLRVISNKKQGFVSSNSTDSNDVKEAASDAVRIANLSIENPYDRILPTENIDKAAPAIPYDEKIAQVSLTTIKDWATVLSKEALKDSKFRLNEGSVSADMGLSLVMNSRGTHKIEHYAIASWGLMGLAIDNDKITSFDYFQKMSRVYNSTADAISKSAKEFRERIINNLNEGTGHSYKGIVLFNPRAVTEVFLSNLAFHFNGRPILEKISKYNKETLGQKIVDSRITLKDMPWEVDRFGMSLFDREGFPTKNTNFIEKGVLKSFMIDSYSGTGLDLKPTGHSAGGPASLPNVGSHSLSLAGGSTPLEKLLENIASEQKDFLCVDRFSGQVDPVTGDFSGVAKGSQWYKNGVEAFTVQETLIAGNLFEALGKDIFDLSRETFVIDNQEEAPYLAIKNVSVTAKG